jgi:hypothetical protein
MDLETVRSLSARDLTDAVDAIGLQDRWKLGEDIREAAAALPMSQALPEPNGSRRQGFQNQVVGRIAERVFRDDHLAALEPEGFHIEDYHEAGEHRDYGAQRDGLELPINVKVASTLFRNAKTVVGLEPEDCVPISAYKAIGASERVPDLVYVDLVDFELRGKVDAFMDGLDGPLGIGWHLLSWYGGKGARAAEDQYINALFATHDDQLKALAPGAAAFRVISAQRVLSILRENPRRVPGLGVPGAGTGGFVAEVNVHISVESEMRSWDDVAARIKCEGIAPVLVDIRQRTTIDVPDPAL